MPGPSTERRQSVTYFRLVEIAVNCVLSLTPRPFTAAMIASEIPAAIRPYSIAVAPESSFTKRAIRFFIDDSQCVHEQVTIWSLRLSQHRDHACILGFPKLKLS